MGKASQKSAFDAWKKPLSGRCPSSCCAGMRFLLICTIYFEPYCARQWKISVESVNYFMFAPNYSLTFFVFCVKIEMRWSLADYCRKEARNEASWV